MRVELCDTIRVRKRVMIVRPSFKSPEDMLEKFQGYLEYCRVERRFCNIAGFCTYIDISRETYYEYKNNKDAIYSDVINKIDREIESELFESKLSPPERIFYLKNKFGYADKIEHVNTNVDVQVEPDEELVKKIRQKYVRDVIL